MGDMGDMGVMGVMARRGEPDRAKLELGGPRGGLRDGVILCNCVHTCSFRFWLRSEGEGAVRKSHTASRKFFRWEFEPDLPGANCDRFNLPRPRCDSERGDTSPF